MRTWFRKDLFRMGSFLMCAALLFTGCQLTEDTQIVKQGEEEENQADITVQVASSRDLAGDFTAWPIVPFVLLDQQVTVDVVDPIAIDTIQDGTYVERYAKLQDIIAETMEQEQPELVSLSWDISSIEFDQSHLTKLTDSEDPNILAALQQVPEALRNDYIIPLGVRLPVWNLRLSELLEVYTADELKTLEEKPLTEILAGYYDRYPDYKTLNWQLLLSAAAEDTPLTYPTPSRLHKGRLGQEDLVQLLVHAMELKDEWGVAVISSDGRLLAEEGGALNGLNFVHMNWEKNTEIFLVRPKWTDPVPYGVALPINYRNASVLEKVSQVGVSEKMQGDMYNTSASIRQKKEGGSYRPLNGAVYYPVVTSLRSEIERIDEETTGVSIPFYVQQSRDFYEQWLASGTWGPHIEIGEETMNRYGALMKVIQETLTAKETLTEEDIRAQLSPFFRKE